MSDLEKPFHYEPPIPFDPQKSNAEFHKAAQSIDESERLPELALSEGLSRIIFKRPKRS